MDPQIKCIICLSELDIESNSRASTKLRCGHTFHFECIYRVFYAKKGTTKCPHCRNVEVMSYWPPFSDPEPKDHVGRATANTFPVLLELTPASGGTFGTDYSDPPPSRPPLADDDGDRNMLGARAATRRRVMLFGVPIDDGTDENSFEH